MTMARHFSPQNLVACQVLLFKAFRESKHGAGGAVLEISVKLMLPRLMTEKNSRLHCAQ